MALITKTISNHPATDLTRVIEVAGFLANDDAKEVTFYYRIQHFLNEVAVPIQVPRKEWKIDNNYKATVRDENFEPIPNPDYTPEYEIIGYTEQPENWDEETDGIFEPQPIYGDTIVNEEEANMLMPAYDYFKQLTFDSEAPVSIQLLLKYYIGDNDTKGFFDFY